MTNPSPIDQFGDKIWYNENDELHREEGPAVECSDGSKEWCINGKYHREDGPAIECADGSKEWWINGKLHREDGPAVEAVEGVNGFKAWWYNGEHINCTTQEEFERIIKLRMFW
jgi:hypothetical protein